MTDLHELPGEWKGRASVINHLNAHKKVSRALRKCAQELDHALKHQERTCIHCGCTDSRACAGGCKWIVKHKATPTGVCTSCADVVEDEEQ